MSANKISYIYIYYIYEARLYNIYSKIYLYTYTYYIVCYGLDSMILLTDMSCYNVE